MSRSFSIRSFRSPWPIKVSAGIREVKPKRTEALTGQVMHSSAFRVEAAAVSTASYRVQSPGRRVISAAERMRSFSRMLMDRGTSSSVRANV